MEGEGKRTQPSESEVNLSKCGVYKYAESPDFEILLFGYSVDGSEVTVIDLAQGERLTQEIIDALTDDTVIKWAFNANFEWMCLSRYLRDLGVSLDPFHDNHPLSTECARFLNPKSWRCSMVWAATMGLPLSLEGVGAVLGLEKQKLTEGKDLIKYFSVPCAPTKANSGRTRNHRKTFYLHYTCIEALYEDILSELSKEYYKAIDKIPADAPFTEVNRVFFEFMASQELYMEKIVCDSSYREFADKLFMAMLLHNRSRHNPHAAFSQTEQNIINTFLGTSSINIYRHRVQDKKSLPLEDLIDLSGKLFYGGISSVL